MTGYMDKKFPFNYLGCPIYSAKKNLSYFDSMLAKFVKRLNGWQSSMLSDVGKITLIKHVLQSIPIYTLSALNLPKGTICLIEMHFANFIWGTSDGKNKYHWSKWENLCFSKDEGGVGIRSIHDISNSLILKRWWRFRTQPSLWDDFLMKKYCKRSHPVSKVPWSADSQLEKPDEDQSASRTSHYMESSRRKFQLLVGQLDRFRCLRQAVPGPR